MLKSSASYRCFEVFKWLNLHAHRRQPRQPQAPRAIPTFRRISVELSSTPGFNGQKLNSQIQHTIMAEVQSPPMQEASHPRRIPERTAALQIPLPNAITLPLSSSASRFRNSHLNLDTFSPVNQNGSFEFDRVLKSGYVQKRTRKTKAWFHQARPKPTTNIIDRLGSQFSSSFDQTLSPYIKIKTRTN